MRILGVRFKNLNSLAGEWQVDFTHPDYSSDGIFAITGPTGAGKTTIMDAVCLGLYGRTPRLDKVTKGSNEIMSRQSGECFAEVTFETQKGRYRCHWSQHRARKRPDGELQQAKHEIADADSGAVLESRITQVGELIESATGMDFERFTRSMLLAQGGFAAFLQAPPDERAPILEQITGTEIYSRISMKVHQRRTEERFQLESLKAELSGIQVLSEEEVKELRASLNEKQDRETELIGKWEEMRKALAWLAGLAALEKELEELDKKRQDFEKRLREFEPKSKKLEKSHKALTIEGDYGIVAALRRQQGNEIDELNKAYGKLPEHEMARANALEAKQAAAARLAEITAGQKLEAAIIRKVRELDTRLSGKIGQFEEAGKSIGETEKQLKEYGTHLKKIGQSLKISQEALRNIDEYIAGHAIDSGLVTNLSAITRMFAGLRDMEAKHIKACEDLSAALRKKESALAECQKRRTDNEKSRQEFARAESELKRLNDALGAMLMGRDPGDWHNELNVLKDRERLLDQADQALDRIDAKRYALDKLKTRLESLRNNQAQLSGEIELCSKKKAGCEKDVDTLERQVSLLSRIRDLDEDRKRLEDGKPCPLCGATDHPYARENIPELSKSEAELELAKAELKETSDHLRKLEIGQAETVKEVQQAQKEAEEKTTALDADEKQCSRAFSELKIETGPGDRLSKIREELAGVKAGIADTSRIIAEAGKKGKMEKAFQKTLEKTRRAFEESEKALQDGNHHLQTADHDHQRLFGECTVFSEQAGKARMEALKEVEIYGIGEISTAGLTAILENLTNRRDTWQAKQADKRKHEGNISALNAELEKYQALSGKLDGDLHAKKKEYDALAQQSEQLRKERHELYGDRNADEEEKRLADAVELAGKALEQSQDKYGQVEKDVNNIKARIASLDASTQKRAKELVQEEQKLTDRIKRAGLQDEADYLSSCLSEEARNRLAEKEESLLKEKTELNARRRDREEALESEREKRLTDQPLEALRENISACDSDLKQVRLDSGGIIRSLSENEKLREKQQERLKNIEAQKKECARWDALHELIGSADGKKFRNFAQGLTFEMMTTHANRQLKKMTDRYLLIRDSAQPLELNVIDNYQAGEIRSTKNLSGGESFIVSLALALGLSQMASRNVRVDSLFLDEGFGTLDEDALETAIETLAGLQQDGKLIGVISHVAALKERIGTQIQVIPEAGGRSSIAGPGCRRI
jgi:exonuclease SbcC